MTLTQALGALFLLLAITAEMLAFWLLPRLGVADPSAGLLAAALGGALAGGLLVWWLAEMRRR
ncbi:hypothetical protein [Rubellimicrobium roseum]|uniref:Uncharacterized protein n=1 Tax=Rubellimicrobium roseum TaxID=687525 RepID=A0A5C4N9W7_9RHOB|nr:hypothetical protein [Rubellimicrobium roseum]TNC63898.1 hypothetical protein FHG71_18930 [Rubellimicrobium roseum]